MAVRFISILISLNSVFLIVSLLIVFLPVQLIFFNRWMLVFFLQGDRSPNPFSKCGYQQRKFPTPVSQGGNKNLHEGKYSGSLARQWFNSPESTNCFNQVASLSRSRKTSEIYITPASTTTPHNSAAMLRKVRQAKLLLQRKDEDLDRAELAGVIDSLERFAINTDKNLQLERDTLRKWQQAQKLAAPVNRKELQTTEGTVLDGAVLHKLYQQRDRAEKKKEAAKEARAQRMSQPVSRKNKGKAPQPQEVSVHFEESEASWISQETQDESGYVMGDWESDLEAPANPDSSLESVIMVATPLPTRYQPPTWPHTPCRPRHVSPIATGRSVGSPMYRVIKSRAARN